MEENEIRLGRLWYTVRRKKNKEVYQILEKYGVNSTIEGIGSTLSLACMSENWEIAKYCIENGANVNSRDSESATPLIDACKYGNLEIVKLLVKAGADLNVQNKYDMTPISKAISHHPKNLELIEYLLENGADPHIKEEYMKDDPRIKTYTAYEYAKYDIEDEALVALIDKYKI